MQDLALFAKGLWVSDSGLEDAIPRSSPIYTRPIVVPVSSVWQGPGNDSVTLLVIGITGLQLPLGGGGAVAHPPPLALLCVVVLKLPGLPPIIQSDTLVGQVSPVSAWVSGNQVNSLLLQGVQRLRDMVRQDGGLLAEVALQVGPRLGLVGDGDLVVAGGDGGQVRDGIPACESSPRCAWPLAGCAVAAPVQHNLLEVGTLHEIQNNVK